MKERTKSSGKNRRPPLRPRCPYTRPGSDLDAPRLCRPGDCWPVPTLLMQMDRVSAKKEREPLWIIAAPGDHHKHRAFSLQARVLVQAAMGSDQPGLLVSSTMSASDSAPQRTDPFTGRGKLFRSRWQPFWSHLVNSSFTVVPLKAWRQVLWGHSVQAVWSTQDFKMVMVLNSWNDVQVFCTTHSCRSIGEARDFSICCNLHAVPWTHLLRFRKRQHLRSSACGSTGRGWETAGLELTIRSLDFEWVWLFLFFLNSLIIFMHI